MKELNIIFYICLIFLIIWEILNIIYNKISFENYRNIVNGVNNDNTKVQSGIDFIYLLIILLGLVTFQWKLFGLILLLSMINKKTKFAYIVDSVVCILVLSFIILNRFHFHWQF